MRTIRTKSYLLLLAFLWWGIIVFGQPGKIYSDRSVKSELLEKEVSYSVYLPFEYQQSEDSLPILYLLHGFTGDHTDWVKLGELERIANATFSDEGMIPMIIVSPDAGDSWYINNHDGTVRYEDFFLQEFIPHIEQLYRVRSEKTARAISGLSMGGYGALLYAIKYPELFTAVAPLSASIRTAAGFEELSEEQWLRMFATPYGKENVNDRVTTHLQQHSILNLITQKSTSQLNQLDYYIDCGDDDHLIVYNMRLHEALIDKNVPHEFRVRDGAHEWDYWKSALPEVLAYVSERFGSR